MAVDDVLYSTFHLSKLIFRHIPTKQESMSGVGFFLKRNLALQWAAAVASISSLVVIAVERYFIVTVLLRKETVNGKYVTKDN